MCLARAKAKGISAPRIRFSVFSAPPSPGIVPNVASATRNVWAAPGPRSKVVSQRSRGLRPRGPSLVYAPEDNTDRYTLSLAMQAAIDHWKYLKNTYVSVFGHRLTSSSGRRSLGSMSRSIPRVETGRRRSKRRSARSGWMRCWISWVATTSRETCAFSRCVGGWSWSV
jgi:hypothetical protein